MVSAMAEKEQSPVTLVAYLAFVLAASLIVYSFVSVAREGETRRRCTPVCLLKPNYAGANRKAPDFTLKALDGKDVALSSFAGKVVVLNFWASWCGPCLKEMPALATMTRILADRSDVRVVTVSADDTTDDANAALKSTLQADVPFVTLFDPGGKAITGAKYGTTQFPETYILDKHGIIRARFDGARDWSDASIIEFIDQLRHDGYCPIEIKEGTTTGEAAKLCEDPTGG
jgi:peroxiredoxin